MEKRKCVVRVYVYGLEMFKVSSLGHIESRTISTMEWAIWLDVCCVLWNPSDAVLVRQYGLNSETCFFFKT